MRLGSSRTAATTSTCPGCSHDRNLTSDEGMLADRIDGRGSGSPASTAHGSRPASATRGASAAKAGTQRGARSLARDRAPAPVRAGGGAWHGVVGQTASVRVPAQRRVVVAAGPVRTPDGVGPAGQDVRLLCAGRAPDQGRGGRAVVLERGRPERQVVAGCAEDHHGRQFDAASFKLAGATHVVSVPNGTVDRLGEGDILPDEDRRFAYLWEQVEGAGVSRVRSPPPSGSFLPPTTTSPAGC